MIVPGLAGVTPTRSSSAARGPAAPPRRGVASAEGDAPPGPARWGGRLTVGPRSPRVRATSWGDVIADGVCTALLVAGVASAAWSVGRSHGWAVAAGIMLWAGARGLRTGP